MAEAKKAEESESMEEILQSIKKIMDDNTGEKPAAAETDVYDLTNVVKEDAPMAEPPATPVTPSAPAAPANSEEVTKSVDSVFSKEAPPTASAAAPTPAPGGDAVDGLMSEYAASAAAKALKTIGDTAQKDYSIPNIPSPQFRSGNTVENLVVESLKPMLKEWLDKNLPVLVQKIVEKEVKRIVNLHFDQ